LLWANWPLVLAVATLTVLVWLLGWCRPAWMTGAAFLPVFAVAVTYSVSLAGIYVVFATLIMTPLILGTLAGKAPFLAACCAVAGHLAAIGLSIAFDVPVGPAIVVMTLGIALLWYSVLCGFGARLSAAVLSD
jgi:zinc/manganese transport system permease protein